MIVIVDYGMGNLRSVLNKLGRLGVSAEVSSDPTVVAKADRLVLPGVGNFGAGMANLDRLGLVSVLDQRVRNEGTPILGICLGVQLFTRGSEETDAAGLGWIEADTVRFDDDLQGLRVPHVGWNQIAIRRDNPLLAGIADESRFYFTHSYHLRCDTEDDVLAATTYGEEFPSIIQRGNIYGTQFHPEKSHRAGLQVIANFFTECE